jgi:TonB family protein
MIDGDTLASPVWAPEFVAAVGASPAGMLLAIYLSVAVLLLARLCIGLLGLWRIASQARLATEKDDVRISTRLRSPATFGSIILLPPESECWSHDQRQAVLIHERAHVRSRDGYWSWLAQLHAAVFWFNPLSWWLRRHLESLAETTSDDAVVAARHDPVSYAALLLAFARQPNSRSVAMSVAESNVPRRIERLLARTSPGTEISRRARWIALAGLIPVMFVAASTTRAIAQAAEPSQAAMAAGGADSVRISRAPDPDQYYPEAARQAQATARVKVEVSVDAQGKLVDARVLEPLPADDPYDFGAAALAVARGAEYSNPLGRTSSLIFLVKFALTSDPPASK